MKITRFEDLDAWKRARILLSKTSSTLGGWKDPDLRDLQRQMRRSALSVMANIAEGFDGGSDAEFRRFLRIARRSATELQSHLYAAVDLGALSQADFDLLYEEAMEVKRVIGGFLRYLNP